MPLRLTSDKSIDKLSGPVGIKILSPSGEYLKKYPLAPLFILYSDRHLNVTNLCEDAPPMCHIHRPEFLKLFCDLLQGNEKIDFYVEGGDIHYTNKITESKEPLVLVWNLFTNCNRNKTSPEEKQIGLLNKISNVRWQSGDIRSWNSYPAEIKQRLDTTKQYDMYNFIQRIKIPDRIIKEERQPYFIFTFKTQVKAIKASGFKFDKKIPIEVQELYNEYVIDQNSLINYQLSEIQIENYKTYIQIRFKSYISFVVKKFSAVFPEIALPDLIKIIKSIYGKLYDLCNLDDKELDAVKYDDERFIELYNKYNDIMLLANFLLKTQALLPDLYTLARTFKRMANNPGDGHSIINMCYFGDMHMTNMASFLTNILGAGNYNNELEINIDLNKSKSEITRCLDFTSTNNTPLSDILSMMRKYRQGKSLTAL